MLQDLIQHGVQLVTGSNSPAPYVLTRWVFLRLLGIIYLIAFISLWVQVKGLIGSSGILPAQGFLDAVKHAHPGPDRFTLLPTLFWFGASDTALQVACALGAAAAAALIVGFAPMACLILAWVLYLSLYHVGQDFLGFQWDILLLEVGFLAIFFAPVGLLPGLGHETAVSPLARFLLLFLLFRLMFESGWVKIASGDLTWRNFTALDFHYWTQPLPAWTSWYVHHLPSWFHRISVLCMFIIEIIFPFFLLLGRPFKLIACSGFILLNLLIMFTGNYTFFNLLTIALSLLVLDELIWVKILPASLLDWIGYSSATLPAVPPALHMTTVVIGLLVIVIGAVHLPQTVLRGNPVLRTIERSFDMLRSLHISNRYGLFAVMTKHRTEIIIEGSSDGKEWKPYKFKWKPNSPADRPRFVQPHQPRLDWQMWFAALSAVEGRPSTPHWLRNLQYRLLQGKKDVIDLLEENPFPKNAPRFMRARTERYQFTSPEEKRQTGNWWKIEVGGVYSPVLSLE